MAMCTQYKFVSDLRQVDGFLRVLRIQFPPPVLAVKFGAVAPLEFDSPIHIFPLHDTITIYIFTFTKTIPSYIIQLLVTHSLIGDPFSYW